MHSSTHVFAAGAKNVTPSTFYVNVTATQAVLCSSWWTHGRYSQLNVLAKVGAWINLFAFLYEAVVYKTMSVGVPVASTLFA